MRVDRDRRLAEGDVEHHIGGLASDARQLDQRRVIGGHFAPMRVDELAAQRQDVSCLGAEQADRLDVRDQAGFAQLEDGLRRMGDRKELRGRKVHAAIGRLRREHDGDQELERRSILEFATRMRILRAQPAEDLEPLGRVHSIPPNRRRRASRSGSLARKVASPPSSSNARAKCAWAAARSPLASKSSPSSSYT